MVRPRPQTLQEELVAEFDTPLLIILNVLYKSYIEEVLCNLSKSVFKIVHWQKRPREVDMRRNNVTHINHCILSKYSQHPVQDKRCLERAGHIRPSLRK